MDRVRATIHVHGRVQGVGFRAWVGEHLPGLGLEGAAQNVPDGTVDVRVTGAPVDVDALVARMRTDAPGQVDQVVVAVEDAGGPREDG